MLGGRGAKGSIRDRLLSILYRIRYRKAIKKKKSLIKKNKIRIFNYLFFKSNFKLEKKCKPIRKDRTVSQKKIYYVRKRKVGIVPKENINNSEINIFVANSKLIVNEIKKDIVKI